MKIINFLFAFELEILRTGLSKEQCMYCIKIVQSLYTLPYRFVLILNVVDFLFLCRIMNCLVESLDRSQMTDLCKERLMEIYFFITRDFRCGTKKRVDKAWDMKLNLTIIIILAF